MAVKTLVVGCGLRPKAGCVNLDSVALPGVDVVFDLDAVGKTDSSGWCSWTGDSSNPNYADVQHKWRGLVPFVNGYFDRIEAEDVLEHVADVVAVVQELGRVLRVGGELWVRGPDARHPETAWADVTHRRAFAPRSFDGFCPDTYDGRLYGHYHGAVKFRMVERATERNHGLEWTLEKV